MPERQTSALQDGGDFTIFLQETRAPVHANGCALWFQVADVDAYLVRLWDERSMKDK